MKIAFLVTRIEKPSARYRVFQYIPFLKMEGYISEVFTIPKNNLDRINMFRKMRNFDIVFLQKKLLNIIELHILRKNSKRLVYDFDDAVMFRDPDNKSQVSKKRMNYFLRTVKNTDIIIAGNKYLKNFSIKENPETFVIPTSVDMNRYTEKQSSTESNPLILGWIGSNATLFYLEKIRNVLDTIFDRFPHVRLKIVSDRFLDCTRMPVIKKHWAYEEEISDLHSFDIGLMPLIDDPWSRGKCGFKLLQYMAIGVPGVASKVGVNSEIIEHGRNGFLADNRGEWVDCLSRLIEDVALRKSLGQEARKTVKE